MNCETEQNTFNFSSNEEYLFVNYCMAMFYGKLPSYCYYFDNAEIYNFWNNLSNDEFKMIYDYLCFTNQIKNTNTLDISKLVIDFVDEYFD